MGEKKYSHWFVIVVAVFVTCLITANIIAVKLVDLFGLILPAAIFIFPLSYITGDVLTEVYGYRQARKVIWLGFLCNVIVVVRDLDRTGSACRVFLGRAESLRAHSRLHAPDFVCLFLGLPGR